MPTIAELDEECGTSSYDRLGVILKNIKAAIRDEDQAHLGNFLFHFFVKFSSARNSLAQ